MTKGIGGAPIDQEAQECIMSLASLLHRFGGHSKAREGELWACIECIAIATQIVECCELLERRVL